MRSIGALSYDRQNVIGKGGFGVVYLGLYQNGSDPKTRVAVKRILRSYRADDDYFIRREIDILMRAGGHPNIRRYFCTEITDDFL